MTKSRPSHKDPEQLGSHRTERLISLHPWNYVLIYSLFYCYCSETVFSALPLSERDPHPYTAWCCFAFCVLEWYYKGCMNQASISKAQTISYSSNIHKSCEFRLYKMKISCIYYLDVSQGGQRKPRLAIWISPFFFFFQTGSGPECLLCRSSDGPKMNDKSSVSSYMSTYVTLFHFTVMLCITVALFCAEKGSCLFVCKCLCVEWVFVCLFLLYGSLPMWFVPFYTDCLWVIYDSNI